MSEAERLLVLVRHGQSDWNLKNLFTGWKDVDLTDKGVAEAREAGRIQRARRAGDRSRRHVGFTEQRRRVRVRVNLANLKL